MKRPPAEEITRMKEELYRDLARGTTDIRQATRRTKFFEAHRETTVKKNRFDVEIFIFWLSVLCRYNSAEVWVSYDRFTILVCYLDCAVSPVKLRDACIFK